MIKSIFTKEWLKIRFYIYFLLISSLIVLAYFAFNLNFNFSTSEPESMMWYRFIQIEQKPYFYLVYFYLTVAIVLAFSQFLPEVIQKRIKLTLHQPLTISSIANLHLFFGVFVLSIFYTFFSISLLSITSHYYPKEITQVIFEDTFAYTFVSIVLYILLSSLIIEQNKKIQILKSIITALFLFTFIKEIYTYMDFLWFFALALSIFIFLDSFYSLKEQRLNKIYKFTFTSFLLVLLVLSFTTYKENYKKEFHRYYIFYSDILDEFVYQKNFGKHNFEYGIKDKETFSQKQYQEYLPFVYWRDLEIQKKLPIKLKDEIYTKSRIKESKLGFEFKTKLLKEKQVSLYPLLNPKTVEGVIKFPEEFFGIFKDGARIYVHDGEVSKNETQALNTKLKELNFSYPAKNIWGKTTNLKSFDLGYLIKDSKNRLFNLRKQNDIITIKEILYPENIDISYINISENKQQKLSGYAIDENSNFYLLTWDFDFIKLDLKNFDYKTMRLKLIADPLHYLIRYDDEETYYASIFSKKDLKKIKEEKWD